MKRAASMASMMSIDEDEMSTEARQCLTALREGKRCVDGHMHHAVASRVLLRYRVHCTQQQE